MSAYIERPTAKSFTPTGNGVANATFVYENNNANPDFAQLIAVNATGGTTYLYGYDAAGRRDAVIQRTASKEFGQVFVYDELDRVKQRLRLPRWPPQNRPVVAGSNPASRASGNGGVSTSSRRVRASPGLRSECESCAVRT